MRLSLNIIVLCFLLATNVNAQQKVSFEKAKPFSLYDLNDNLVEYSDFAGKKILILSFFATWCEPCLKEIKELEDFSTKLDTSTVEILLISTDKGKRKTIKDFVKKHQIKFRVIHDIYGITAKKWKVNDLPTLFLIDKSGNILFRQQGYSEKIIEKIKSKIGDFVK